MVSVVGSSFLSERLRLSLGKAQAPCGKGSTLRKDPGARWESFRLSFWSGSGSLWERLRLSLGAA